MIKNRKKAILLALLTALNINILVKRSKLLNEEEVSTTNSTPTQFTTTDDKLVDELSKEEEYTIEHAYSVENIESTYSVDTENIENEIVEETEEKDSVVIVDNYAYLTCNSYLYNSCDENKYEIAAIDKYQKVYAISTNGEYTYVLPFEGEAGYILSDNIELLPENFVEVDISDQLVTVYYDNETVLEANVVTGANGHETDLGYTEILEKTYNRPLVGPTWNVDVSYFFPFNYDGEGFHDASWRNEFGGNIYTYNGSHGCVNMTLEDVKEMDNYIEVGTKVLVHK